MEFETEFAHAYIAQTLFNDLKRGLLFGNEQNALGLVHSVGDYICYRLAFASSGGDVEHESSALCGLGNGGILRAVAGQRREHGAGVAVVFVCAVESVARKFVCIGH